MPKLSQEFLLWPGDVCQPVHGSGHLQPRRDAGALETEVRRAERLPAYTECAPREERQTRFLHIKSSKIGIAKVAAAIRCAQNGFVTGYVRACVRACVCVCACAARLCKDTSNIGAPAANCKA